MPVNAHSNNKSINGVACVCAPLARTPSTYPFGLGISIDSELCFPAIFFFFHVLIKSLNIRVSMNIWKLRFKFEFNFDRTYSCCCTFFCSSLTCAFLIIILFLKIIQINSHMRNNLQTLNWCLSTKLPSPAWQSEKWDEKKTRRTEWNVFSEDSFFLHRLSLNQTPRNVRHSKRLCIIIVQLLLLFDRTKWPWLRIQCVYSFTIRE